MKTQVKPLTVGHVNPLPQSNSGAVTGVFVVGAALPGLLLRHRVKHTHKHKLNHCSYFSTVIFNTCDSI